MSKPKFVKPILIGVACAVPVGLVVGLSVNWDHTQFISAVGSSGVKPFIEKFGKAYHEINSNIDVTVESGGTTFAVEQLAKGYTNLGNASNNPYLNIHDQGYASQWENKKTLTLGWEGLCIMYSLPNGLSKEARQAFDIVISEENIQDLYSVFSCIHNVPSWQDGDDCMWRYMTAEAQASCNTRDEQICKATKILPFLRSGGNTGANSSIAFTRYSNLVDFEDLPEVQQKAFDGGNYGNDNPHMETDESNSRAWQSFVNTNKPGSMVYLTTSFLAKENNIKQIKEHGYKLAKYQAKGSSTPIIFDLDHVNDSLDQICVTGKYNWFRPINVMLDINLKKAKDFLWWIYFGSASKEQVVTSYRDDFEAMIHSLGAKAIDLENNFSTMCKNGTVSYENLFSTEATDLALEEVRATEHEGLFKEVYGAEDLWE
ncbi:MAG: substrate-binding domain-containing protein [Mycoplasmoidaceae bacterium]